VDVVTLPPGELFSETNDNSVAILLSYGTARVLLAGDAEAREEEYMANGSGTELASGRTVATTALAGAFSVPMRVGLCTIVDMDFRECTSATL
jgi:hypothetical protein